MATQHMSKTELVDAIAGQSGVEKKQVERLKKLKGERDNQQVQRVLDRVRHVARSDENLMPVLIEAVKSYATVGEISDAPLFLDLWPIFQMTGEVFEHFCVEILEAWLARALVGIRSVEVNELA